MLARSLMQDHEFLEISRSLSETRSFSRTHDKTNGEDLSTASQHTGSWPLPLTMTTRSYLSIARKNAVAPVDPDVPSENATAASEPVKKESKTPTPFSNASNRSSDPVTPARTDPTASISNTTQATTANSNTACTSPLTVTSLEQQAAGLRPPVAVVEQPSHVPVPQPPALGTGPEGGADGLIRGMAAMGLGHALPQPLPGPALPNMAALPPPKSQGNGQHDVWGQQGRPNKHHHIVGPARTPPTEHDNRKLFVGGLPTDGE